MQKVTLRSRLGRTDFFTCLSVSHVVATAELFRFFGSPPACSLCLNAYSFPNLQPLTDDRSNFVDANKHFMIFRTLVLLESEACWLEMFSESLVPFRVPFPKEIFAWRA